jgi:hypothetical protein
VSTIVRFALGILALLGLTIAACADDAPKPIEIKSVTQRFATGENATPTVGQLLHRGSLRLTSEDADFGGISGLIVSDDGERFLAITDSSHWLTGTIRYRDGKLAGVEGKEIAPLLDLDGNALSGKDGDAEGLGGSLNGDVYVSFERDHRIWRYAFGKDGLKAKPVAVKMPAVLKQAPDNSGLEAITVLGDGRVVALTEAFYDDSKNIRGWVIEKGKAPRAIALKQRAPFDITDLRELPNGDLLTLERRFSRAGGVGFEMRRIARAALDGDEPIEAEVIADVGMTFMIDNMEGLSVRKDEDGRTIVYAVSDDNFNKVLQQTLLMMFELKE